MEELGANERTRVIDGYAQKLLNSGYSREQTRSILVMGIKGYEGRFLRYKAEGRKIRRRAKKVKELGAGRNFWPNLNGSRIKSRKKTTMLRTVGGRSLVGIRAIRAEVRSQWSKNL